MAQSLLFFLIGILFDFSLFRIEIIYCLLLSIITSLLFLGLGILFGTLCNERSVGGVASIIISAQSLLSGMWFPLEGLSDGFIKIMEILPFKNATILLQNSLNGSDYILSPLLIVLLYSIGVFLLAIIVYKSKMKSK
jgi:ABC-2 type transport system permease protein